MGAYFRSWKRMLGLLTLAGACLLMFGWLRSTATSDYVRVFPHQFHGLLIHSSRQVLWLQLWSGEQKDDSWQQKKRKRPKRSYEPERFAIHLNEELTRRVAIGSTIATVFQPETGHFKWSYHLGAPYWSIDLPLTLLSAWLLLSKPRSRSRPTSIPQHVPI